jgi:hypothetical protein
VCLRGVVVRGRAYQIATAAEAVPRTAGGQEPARRGRCSKTCRRGGERDRLRPGCRGWRSSSIRARKRRPEGVDSGERNL